MAKEALKQMDNRVTLQGTLIDNHIAIKVDSKGRRYLSGAMEVQVDNEYVIPVDTFSYEFKSNGEKNNLYERIAKTIEWPTVKTVGRERAAKVTVTNARIEDNSFWSDKDSKVVNNWRISGSFFKLGASDIKNINEFEVEGIISSIKEIINKSGESTNQYQIKLYNIGFGEKVNEITLIYDDPAAVKYINDNYNVGDKVTLCGQIVYDKIDRVVEKELGFGEPVKTTFTNTIRSLKITAGTEPETPENNGIALKDLTSIVVKQNNIIKEKAEARAQSTNIKQSNSVNNLLF